MGPEPLIIPFAAVALLLLLGAILSAVVAKRVLVRVAAYLVLVAALVVFAMTYVSTKTIVQNLALSLFYLGYLVFGAFPVVVVGALVILPIKRLFERSREKNSNASEEVSR